METKKVKKTINKNIVKENLNTKVKSSEEDGIHITNNFHVANEVLEFIPHESAELYKMVPIAKRNNVLYIGLVDIKNIDARDALNFITLNQGVDYKIQKITKAQFQIVLDQYGKANTAVSDALEQLEEEHSVVLGIDDEDVSSVSKGFLKEEAPVIRLVSTILAQAVAKEVSDIHIEPFDTYALVRYRLDGILQEELRFPRRVHDSLVARIKILSNLRLDERRRPQDGRFSSTIKKNRVDFRVATFPTSNGEKVILRVLDKQKGLRDLGELGFSESVYESVLKATKKPHGLILATGPTGAGKTTTLYALLNILDKKTKNIVSLEDPVEYSLSGINQSNIRPEIGYSFASGLRSVLRGDPDQILVGEIRDKETAQLAIQAALTGHVVYSTLHTNTAIGAVSRLINFGIDPFLLAPTISLIIGQRMSRKLDGEAKDLLVTSGMKKYIDNKFSDLPQVYKSIIPEALSFKEALPRQDNPTGLKGRVGIFESLEINEEIKSIILDSPTEKSIYTAARKSGFITMQEDAIIKGLKGTIPLTEVVKIGNEGALANSEYSHEGEDEQFLGF